MASVFLWPCYAFMATSLACFLFARLPSLPATAATGAAVLGAAGFVMAGDMRLLYLALLNAAASAGLRLVFGPTTRGLG